MTGRASQSESAAARFRDAKVALLGFVTVALGALVVSQVPGLTGPAYYQWPWRRIDAIRLYPAMFVAFLPFVVGQYLYQTRRRSAAIPLSLCMLSLLALELTAIGMQQEPFDASDKIVSNILDPMITSYFGDASKYTNLRDFLGSFHLIMPSFHTHSLTKPPGPVLFHASVRGLIGDLDTAALAAGLAIAVLSTSSVVAVYLLVRLLGRDGDAAFCAASFFSLCPGPILFFPEFDQIYPVLSSALVGSWVLALRTNRAGSSLAFGLVLSLICFVSYSLLVLGIFLALYSLLIVFREPEAIKRVAGHAAIGLATVIGSYTLLWLSTGFDAIATFATAADHQARIGASIRRPELPAKILLDLADFALSAGWIGFLLASYFVAGKLGDRADHELWITCLGFAQFVGVAVSGLLAGEAARVWIFMLPLLMFPVGLELRRWSHRARMAAYTSLWFLTTAIHQNMRFVG